MSEHVYEFTMGQTSFTSEAQATLEETENAKRTLGNQT